MPTDFARWTAASALILLIPGASSAQNIPSVYRHVEHGQEATMFAGSIDPDRGQFGFGLGKGLLLGGRYTLEIGGPFALEAVTSLLSASRNVVDPARQEGDRIIGEVDHSVFAVDLRLRFSLTGRRTWRRIQPYVFLGGGFAFDLSGSQELDEELGPADRFDFGTKFTSPFGGGLRYILNDRFAIRTDLYITLFKLDTPSGWSDPERGFEGVGESDWVNARTMSIGLAYMF